MPGKFASHMSVSVLITPEFVLSPALEAEWLARLPPARRAEVAGRHDGRSRHRSLLGIRLLAEGLQRLGHGRDALASLSYPPRGRPALDLPVSFSLSHCDGRVVCALSTHGPVGIDVERLGDLKALDFHLYLNQAERNWAGRSARRFYSLWTRKEAVAKAAGSRGLRDVAAVDTASTTSRAVLAGRLWHTPEVPVGPDHVAHLALISKPSEVTFGYLDRQALELGRRPVTRSAAAMCCSAVL